MLNVPTAHMQLMPLTPDVCAADVTFTHLVLDGEIKIPLTWKKSLVFFFVIFIICSGSKPVKTTKESSVNVSRINFNKLTVSKCSLSVIVLLAQNQHGCEKSCLASLNQYANVLIYGQSDSSWMMRDPTLSIYPILTVFVFFSLFLLWDGSLVLKITSAKPEREKKQLLSRCFPRSPLKS